MRPVEDAPWMVLIALAFGFIYAGGGRCDQNVSGNSAGNLTTTSARGGSI